MLRTMTAALALALALSGAVPAAAKERLNVSWPVNVGPLNPHLYSPNQMFAQAMVYEPLVRWSADGTLAPALATSWEIADDGRVYTFHLRPGVRFSNGEPFDAAAVAANIRTVLDNRDQHSWLELTRRIRNVEAVDPLTVRLTLDAPYYPTLHELALPRPFRFIAPSQLKADAPGGVIAPIGTGPWKLVETRPGAQDLFARNDAWWGARPHYDEIAIKVIPDPNARVMAFETGDVDLIAGVEGPIPPDAFARFRNTPGVVARVSAPLETRMLALNSQHGPTADLAVRRAVNHAIDKDAIVNHALHGTQGRADFLFSPGVPYADVGLAPYAFDRDRAARLLDEAGWTLKPGARVRARNGEPLDIDLMFVGGDAVAKTMAEAIQADLARIGVRVRLVGEAESSIHARQRDGRFGMVFNSTWGAPYDPHAFISAMRAPSHADYQAQRGLPDKAQIDALIGETLASTDEEARRALYRKLLTRLHESAVYAPLTTVTAMSVSRASAGEAPFGATANEIPFERFGHRTH